MIPYSFFTNKFNIIFLILFAFIFIQPCFSQTKNKTENKIPTNQLNQFLINGQLDSLFSLEDTLKMHFYLFGGFYSRADNIMFYKDSNTFYIKPEIIETFNSGNKIVIGKEKKYNLSKNDSLNFEYLIGDMQKTLFEKRDSIGEMKPCISIGVFNKWGKNYYSVKWSDDYFRIYKLFERIMFEIYPEMEEYKPLIIIDDVIKIGKD